MRDQGVDQHVAAGPVSKAKTLEGLRSRELPSYGDAAEI